MTATREERLSDKQREYDELAPWFDTLYPRDEDFKYYRERFAECGSPVLELGCGTGRLTCALAEGGATIVGLDLSPNQLALAERRKSALPPQIAARVDFRRGSMTGFDFAERFSMIAIPFTVLMELRTSEDRVDAFRHCAAHLAPHGKLFIDNFYRGMGELANWGKPRPPNVVTFWGVHPHPTDKDREVHHFEVQEYDTNGGMLLHIFVDQVGPDGIVQRKAIHVRRQYVSPEQMSCELHNAGFNTIHLYGSFDRHAIGDPAVAGKGRVVCEAAIA